MTLFNNGDQPVDMMEIARQTTARDVERRKPGTVKVVAPAKVNLVLKVGERREDGYHPLENVFQAVMLHDLVYLWPEGPEGTVTCECVAFESLPPVDAAPEDNLAARAVRTLAKAVFGAADAAPGIGIRIEKHIPAQAGLGGGSSDAAAALVGAARVWTDAGALAPDAVTPEMLEAVAAPLGADVTFFLRGGAALYDGVGEHFVRAYAPRKDAVAIIKPDAGLSTGAVYRAFDEGVGREADSTGNNAAGEGAGNNAAGEGTSGAELKLDVVAAADLPLINDLQAPSVALLPEIGRIIRWASAQPATRGVMMSGSGSAVFVICSDFAGACKLTASAKLQGWWARTTAFGPVKAAVVPA